MIDFTSELGKLDSKLFKAFVSAARLLNFTEAAKRTAMTQSGVSQHVSKLEHQLGARLFTRIHRKVLLTTAGELLLKFCEAQKESEDELLEKIKTDQICGRVRYAMPYSCLFAPHLPRLLEMKNRLASIELAVNLTDNYTVFEKLLRREIDFGFVTRREKNPALDFEYFCQEEYILAGKIGSEKVSQKDLLAMKFVDYPGMQVLFNIWAHHQFGMRALSFGSFKTGGFVDTLPGAILMIEHGPGVTTIPKHCVRKQLANKSLWELYGPNKSPLLNDISLVTLKGVPLPEKAKLVIALLKQAAREPN